MTRYDQVAARWRDNVLSGSGRMLTNERMPVYGDRIYSYGLHFELARPLRDRRGNAIAFLLNGDRYSNTTSKHQSVVRSVLHGHQTVIIPHSVLSAAGISMDSVRILDSTPDRTETVKQTSRDYADLPARWRKHRQEPSAARADGFPEHEWDYTFDGQTYRWVTYRHWLGESLIEAEVAYSVTCRNYIGSHHTEPHPDQAVPEPDFPGDYWSAEYRAARNKWYESNEYNDWRDRRQAATDRWHASLVPATCSRHTDAACYGRIRKARRAKYLSGFDHNERRPSYFFCELPAGATATTVAEAYDALKPDTVRFAEALGRDVKRQGDIFAIPTEIDRRALRKAGATFAKRGGIFATNHVATEVAVLPDGTTLARGCLSHDPGGRAPDHARVRLGNNFHILVKNTVPLAA